MCVVVVVVCVCVVCVCVCGGGGVPSISFFLVTYESRHKISNNLTF